MAPFSIRDLAGNRMRKVQTGYEAETITYTYDSRDELTAEDSSNDAHDASYGYDCNGAMLYQSVGGQETAYVWEPRGRMACGGH
jgi:hypothetical protein